MAFPEQFVWAAASASYQIEGAAYEDGKGLSVWDVFCRRPGAILQDDNGDIACDHYHRYAEDVALMKSMGLKAYRFSVCWPRVIPAGTGAVNDKGVDFYDKLVDELLAAGIDPYVTLFHWDYPYELFCRGGWFNPASSDWFAEYAGVLVERLSDRVTNWFTLNEPNVFIGQGHVRGRHAPGLRVGTDEVLRAMWNVLLSHGKAVQAIRAGSKKGPRVGLAPGVGVAVPATDKTEDVEAARKHMFNCRLESLGNSAWWTDPIFLGVFPEEGLARAGGGVFAIDDGDMEIIHQPLDFCGANIYYGRRIAAGTEGKPEVLPWSVGHDTTARRWVVLPEALYWGPKFLYERYAQPIMITENGLSNIDLVGQDDRAVHDPQRIEFMRRYLRQLGRAIDDGVVVTGYFHWSIMDNFEWSFGYQERFGLIYVDYPTQERIPKDSAHYYRDVIASNGEKL